MGLPASRRDYLISRLVSQQLGSASAPSRNSRDLLVQVKNALVASGAWEVTRSCDGLTISTTDLWTDWTKLQGLGGTGGYSWITLRNTRSGVQLMIAVTTTVAWTQLFMRCSPAVGFTGGDTAGAFPNAADAFDTMNPVGGDWLGTGPSPAPDDNPQFRAFVWVSTDSALTRVAWWYKGKLIAWWQFDEIGTPADGAWVPFVTITWDGGNDYLAPNPARMLKGVFNINATRVVRTNTANNEVPALFGSQFGLDWFVDRMPQNQQSGQYLWEVGPGLYVTGQAPPRNGPMGYLQEQWWVGATGPGGGPYTPVFNDGDTADSGDWIFVGQMMLPWDGTVNPPHGGSTTVDRPASVFFGLECNGACECGDGSDDGEDDCDAATATLGQMRRGAQELADRADDDSISTFRWNTWINDGIEDWWKRVVAATGDAFYDSHDFTLAGGAGGNTFDVTTIPERNFRRLTLLEVDPGTSRRRRVRPFNFAEMDRGAPVSNAFDPARRYRRKGTLIMIEPFERAAGNYRVHYVPKVPKLVGDCDEVGDVHDEWREYFEVFAAMKALGKEDSDPGYLPTRMKELREDIAKLKGEPDDDPGASGIADVEDLGGGDPWDL